jgi:hypothetical protein
MNPGQIDDIRAALKGQLGPERGHFHYDPDEGFDFVGLGLGLSPTSDGKWQVWAMTEYSGGRWDPPDVDFTDLGEPYSSFSQALSRVVGIHAETEFENCLGALGEARDYEEAQALGIPF